MKLKEAYIENSYYSRKEFNDFIVPLLEKIIAGSAPNRTALIGVQGGQGTGKTALVRYLKKILAKMRYSSVVFSIDDFYKSYEARMKMAAKNKGNPFYRIARGMPGTHRIAYLKEVLARVKRGERFKLPVFDKSLHNGAGNISGEITVKKRPDFVFFEGWLLGMPCVKPAKLLKICREKKVDVSWFADKDLQEVMDYCPHYEELWHYLDIFVVLEAAALELHYRWRYTQEKSLKQKKGKGMRKAEVYNFVKHFIPLTLLIYEKTEPDLKLKIDKEHKFFDMIWKNQDTDFNSCKETG